MPVANIFKIESGVFCLKLVDTAAVGYLPAWQTPGGTEVDDVLKSAYTGTNGISFECQVTSAALTASANTTDDTTPATMCQPEQTETIVGVTSYSLDATVLQDPNVSAGISAYLFEHDTKEAFFMLALDGDGTVPPKAVGRVRLTAGAIGGDVRTTLTADVSLPVTRKPDCWFGTATTNRIVKGDGSAVTVFAAGAATPQAEDQQTAPTSDEV